MEHWIQTVQQIGKHVPKVNVDTTIQKVIKLHLYKETFPMLWNQLSQQFSLNCWLKNKLVSMVLTVRNTSKWPLALTPCFSELAIFALLWQQSLLFCRWSCWYIVLFVLAFYLFACFFFQNKNSLNVKNICCSNFFLTWSRFLSSRISTYKTFANKRDNRFPQIDYVLKLRSFTFELNNSRVE